MSARRGAGFTLVEVLVALVLMALLAGMAWRGLDGMLRAGEQTQQSIERSATLQTALMQWEQDLEQIQDSGKIVPALAFDGRFLRLTRRHPQGLQVVAWYLEDGQWCRWASAPVTGLADLRRAWERSQQPVTLAAERLSVQSGVQDLQLYYFWDNAWANAQSTGGEAPVEKEASPPAPAPSSPSGEASGPVPGAPTAADDRGQPLPKGIRLQLQFGPGSGLNGTLTRQVLLAGAS